LSNSLGSWARAALLPGAEATRLNSLRRSDTLFSQGQNADAVYLLEDGVVKLTRSGSSGGRIILSICGAGYLIGEDAFSDESAIYYSDAEIISSAAVAYRFSKEALRRLWISNPEIVGAFMSYVVGRKTDLAQKVELLCLHDVEYRILHYLAQLSHLVKPLEEGVGYQLPITQLELADLVGATRETTSTTLNQLERRGLVKLSRRLLTISSPAVLLKAASSKTVAAEGMRAEA